MPQTPTDSYNAAPLIRAGSTGAEGYVLRPLFDLLRGPAGIYLGPESGTSIDFHDYRPYQPGDDLQRIDWGVYARTDMLVLRLYRIEVSPVIEVYLDTSASMGVYEGKKAAATLLAAFLAGLARKAEGRPVLMLKGARLSGQGFEAGLEQVEYEDAADPPEAFSGVRSSGRPVRFVISDFLFPAGPDQFLASLTHNAAALIPVVVLSQTEREPDLSGGMRLVDAENPALRHEIRIDAGAVSRYRRRLTRHLSDIERTARRMRSSLVRLEVPDVPPEPSVLISSIAGSLVREGIVEPA